MTSTINRQITTNNLENFNRSSQSLKGMVMKRAGKYTMSLAFAATVLTSLLTGTGTAQANQCKYVSQTTGYCPIDNNSGYFCEYINGSWYHTFSYSGASTNMVYWRNLASNQLYAFDTTKGILYRQTATGNWISDLDEKIIRLQALLGL